MKQCRSCKRVYSDKHSRCPHCGSFSRSENVSFFAWLRYNVYYILVILFLTIFLIILSIIGQ